jgi:hypothetical protein
MYSGGVFSNVVNELNVITLARDVDRIVLVPKSPSFTISSHSMETGLGNSVFRSYLWATNDRHAYA